MANDELELEATEEEGEPVNPGDGEDSALVSKQTVPEIDDEGERPNTEWGETGVEDSSKAQQTFTSQPVPPYLPGDIWESSSTRICVVAKTEDEVFSEDDWIEAIPESSEPQVSYKTTKIAELITDYSEGKLEEYEQSGAVAYALYDDGTRQQVAWSEVVKPTINVPSSVVNEALAVANATNQHFWTDDSGVHVSEASQDDFINNPSLPNLLINGNGILLRNALQNLAQFTPSTVAFYDGDGNQDANITACFGSDGAQIGTEDGVHLVVDSDSVDLVEDDTTFAQLGLDHNGDSAQPYLKLGQSGRLYIRDMEYATHEVWLESIKEDPESWSNADVVLRAYDLDEGGDAYLDVDGTYSKVAIGNYDEGDRFTFSALTGDLTISRDVIAERDLKAGRKLITTGAAEIGGAITANGNPIFGASSTISATCGGNSPIFYLNASGIDVSQTNNGVSTTNNPRIEWRDQNNKGYAALRAAVAAGGNISSRLYTNNYDTDGITGTAYIEQTVTKAGAVSYALSHPEAFLEALGISDTGWITPTLGSAFQVYNSSAANTPQYRKIGNRVEIRGIVAPTAEISAGGTGTIFTLPTGFRPSQQVRTLCQGSGKNTWLLYINTTGAVILGRYGTTANAACPTSAWLPFTFSFFVD